MAALFFRQFWALCWKNWIVLSKHPLLNLLRCFLAPVGYGIFLAVAQLFLIKPNNYGLGSPVPIRSLNDAYDGSMAFIWADGTNGLGVASAADVMALVTRNFTDAQMHNVKQLASPEDIPAACRENFNLFSECFAAVSFNTMPVASDDSTPINYTIHADGGLAHIDVVNHLSDYELRVLPLQFAIDRAIIELQTGVMVPTPMELPFSQETNEEQSTSIRLSYIRGLRTLLVLALFICFVGISYQLPGSFMGERANLLTAHLKAMGLLDSARIVSWHVSVSLAYLPAWIIVAIVWHYRIFTASNVGLIIVVHLLLGFTLASWSFFVSAPFGQSPQLAAVVSTFLSILFAILALVFAKASTGAAFIFTIIFPPGFYIFAIRAICGFENHQLATNLLKGDPDNNVMLLPLIVAAIIDVFLWPWLAVLLERRLYDPRNPSKGKGFFRFRKQRVEEDGHPAMSPNTAISIRNLSKVFNTSTFRRGKGLVTAVADLTLDIPKYGIYVLLGSNGAGKSTTLSILGNLLGRTSGSVTFEGNVSRPPRGTIGIVPQKNVLFPDLTCYQTLRVWSAIKRSDLNEEDDIEQLLRACDLGRKMHSNANVLSGGQKRKLQLAIGLVGGSPIVLVDECTSGVDPLSRRALWKTLIAVRHERTIVFTTHFLDEADLLADTIAVIAPPGKLVAEGTPVALKSNLGEGYTVQVTFNAPIFDFFDEKTSHEEKLHPVSRRDALLDRIRTVAPSTYVSSPSPTSSAYHLKSKDSAVVESVLQVLDAEGSGYGVASYDVYGTTIEDIFLDLMSRESHPSVDGQPPSDSQRSSSAGDHQLAATEKPIHTRASSTMGSSSSVALALTDGRRRSPYTQAFTIVHKRFLVARRSWLTPVLAVVIAVAGCCVPLFFMSGRAPTCAITYLDSPSIPLYAPISPIVFSGVGTGLDQVITSPPNITATLGTTGRFLQTINLPDNATFVNTIDQNYRNITLGGVSMNVQTRDALIAWEGTSPGLTALTMLNLATNLQYALAMNSSGMATSAPSLIMANYQDFPPVNAGTLFALKWVAFFSAAMSVYPAFFSLYVSRERRSQVQQMQFSNGLANPIALWLGHLIFDSMISVVVSTIIVIVFATASNQFNGLGLFWVVLVLYGIVGALFAYCVSLIMASPLSSFAAIAGYQIIMFVLYLAGYLLTLTYAKTSQAGEIITKINFTMSILSPVANVIRACLVSVNLFSLLCDGSTPVTAASLGDILRYGGPIVYLIVYGLILFAILVWVDSGSTFRRRLSTWRGRRRRDAATSTENLSTSGIHDDVDGEAKAVAVSEDSLRVMGVTKSFGRDRPVVDDVSFGVGKDTCFALLGPNGAGKTTTFNMIRGDIFPNAGDILIKNTSVIQHPRTARLSLGVCPQFTAIDPQLTVAEHLLIYGRLKGLRRGEEVKSNVDMLMHATGLDIYKDRLASKLSGGNQRKLALAIALMGNPSVILIDEFSTGIDAKMKREMWGTLRNVAVGKAIVITTHSMEEASALANKVGILARKMLAVGTTTSLAARYASYEVHISCRTREEVLKAQELMARIVPEARLKDDVATRFEVPIQSQLNVRESIVTDSVDVGLAYDGIEGDEERPESTLLPPAEERQERLTLARLFHLLATQGDFAEYTVERASLESVFLTVIRENDVKEEEGERKRWWRSLV